MAIFTLNRRKFSAVYADGASSGTPGTALANGKVWVTVAGGTYSTASDYKPCWTDGIKTSSVTRNGDGSISLDAAGEAEIWFEGVADIRVASSTDELQYTQDLVRASLPNVITGESNLIPNGSFEQDDDADLQPNDWTITPFSGATVEMDDTTGDSSHGTYSLKFIGTGAGGGFARSNYFPVSTNAKPLRIDWEFKQQNADTGSYFVEVFWYKDNAGTASATASTIVQNMTSGASTTWTAYSAVAAVPSDAVYAQLRITGIGSAGSDKSGTAWYDNVRAYQDGTSSNNSGEISFGTSTTVSYDSIPEWATKVEVYFANVSTDGTNPINIRFYDGNNALVTHQGGVTQVTGTNTTTITPFNSTAGIPIMDSGNAATDVRNGRVTMASITSKVWAGDMVAGETLVGDTQTAGFRVVATDDYISKVEFQSSDNFDSGNFIVRWEG